MTEATKLAYDCGFKDGANAGYNLAKNDLDNKIQKLRKSLADLVGASTKEELEKMELIIRSAPGIEQDKIVAINAIHALIETA